MVSVSPGLQIEVAHNFTDAPSQQAWDALLHESVSDVVFLSRRWQQIWWDNFAAQENCKLHIVSVLQEGGAALAIAPLFIEAAPLPPLRPYAQGTPRPEGEGAPLRTVRFVGGLEVADYLDIIAPAERLGEAWSAVLDYLIEIGGEWDVIDLHSLPEFSPSHDLLSELAAEKGLTADIFPEDVCPVIPLPEEWDTYLMSLRKKDRHELRRKVRKLEGRDDVRWYLVDPADRDALMSGMQKFIELHRKSGSDKAEFMTEPMAAAFLDMASRLADTGWLDLAILEVAGEPASAYLSFRYNNRLYLYNSGYDPKFGSYSAGVALLAYRIHKAILQEIKFFDFLRGDEDYKYDFGAENTYVYRALLKRNTEQQKH